MKKIISEIMDIRSSGKVNMCDIHAVQRIAFEQGFFELVNYIEENPRAYFRFILYGNDEQLLVD